MANCCRRPFVGVRSLGAAPLRLRKRVLRRRPRLHQRALRLRVAYPSDLIPQPESENSDGRAFLSRNGNVEATAWGMWKAAISQSTPDLARESETDCAGPPAYERIASTF